MCRVYYSHSNNAQWVYFMAGVESLLTESGKVKGTKESPADHEASVQQPAG